MTDTIATIKNLGPAYAAACARAGIHSADELRALGPDAAYERLLRTGTKPHFIGYYAMVMGLQGRPWNDCRGKEKDALRQRFDAIKAAARGPQEQQDRARLDAVLNEIGVIAKP